MSRDMEVQAKIEMTRFGTPALVHTQAVARTVDRWPKAVPRRLEIRPKEAASAQAHLTPAMWNAVEVWRWVRTVGPIVAADLVALGMTTAAVYLACRLVLGATPGVVAVVALLVLALLPLAYGMSGMYSEVWLHPVMALRQLTLVSTIVLAAGAVGGLLMWPVPLWCLLAWPLVVFLVPFLRILSRRYLIRQAWWGFPALVIGSGHNAEEVVRTLLEYPRAGLRPVLMSDLCDMCHKSSVPVINDLSAIKEQVRRQAIRHAVVSLPDMCMGRLTAVLDLYSDIVPHLLVVPNSLELPSLWGVSRYGGQISGIQMRNGLLLATMLCVKRAIDVSVATTALCLGAPLMGAIWLLLKFSGPGPVFFGHSRIGRRGRSFKAWKFRTMHPDSDRILREHLARFPEAHVEWERNQKLRDDPRVTRIGRILRRLSLDELPQLWNVLRGHMSLVGPRPIVGAEVSRYGDLFPLYTTVKPGITGLWQVSGRNDVDYEHRVLLDQFYVRNWSPWLDIYILAKTGQALLRRDGAY